MDAAKDFFDTITSRLRSHFFSSIILSFIGFNWKPLFYLFTADKTVRARFLYVEENLVYCWPIVVGIIAAFFIPWVTLAGAWIVKIPHAKIKNIEAETNSLFVINRHVREKNEAEAEKAAAEKRAAATKAVNASLHAEEEKRKAEKREQIDNQLSQKNTQWQRKFNFFEDYLQHLGLSNSENNLLDRIKESSNHIVITEHRDNTDTVIIDGYPLNAVSELTLPEAAESLKRKGVLALTYTNREQLKVYVLTDDGRAVITWGTNDHP